MGQQNVELIKIFATRLQNKIKISKGLSGDRRVSASGGRRTETDKLTSRSLDQGQGSPQARGGGLQWPGQIIFEERPPYASQGRCYARGGPQGYRQRRTCQLERIKNPPYSRCSKLRLKSPNNLLTKECGVAERSTFLRVYQPCIYQRLGYSKLIG